MCYFVWPKGHFERADFQLIYLVDFVWHLLERHAEIWCTWPCEETVYSQDPIESFAIRCIYLYTCYNILYIIYTYNMNIINVYVYVYILHIASLNIWKVWFSWNTFSEDIPSLTAAVATSEEHRPLSSVDNRCVGFHLRKRWTTRDKDDNKRRQRTRDGNYGNIWNLFFFESWKGLMNSWSGKKDEMESHFKRGILPTRSVYEHINCDPRSSIQVKIQCSQTQIWARAMTWLDFFFGIPWISRLKFFKKSTSLRRNFGGAENQKTYEKQQNNHSLTAVCWQWRFWCHWPGVAPCADS